MVINVEFPMATTLEFPVVINVGFPLFITVGFPMAIIVEFPKAITVEFSMAITVEFPMKSMLSLYVSAPMCPVSLCNPYLNSNLRNREIGTQWFWCTLCPSFTVKASPKP